MQDPPAECFRRFGMPCAESSEPSEGRSAWARYVRGPRGAVPPDLGRSLEAPLLVRADPGTPFCVILCVKFTNVFDCPFGLCCFGAVCIFHDCDRLDGRREHSPDRCTARPLQRSRARHPHMPVATVLQRSTADSQPSLLLFRGPTRSPSVPFLWRSSGASGEEAFTVLRCRAS